MIVPTKCLFIVLGNLHIFTLSEQYLVTYKVTLVCFLYFLVWMLQYMSSTSMAINRQNHSPISDVISLFDWILNHPFISRRIEHTTNCGMIATCTFLEYTCTIQYKILLPSITILHKSYKHFRNMVGTKGEGILCIGNNFSVL